jgi:UDP-N-acetylmuramoyl-tripeptide--D-alanyl-D-alanine ligase
LPPKETRKEIELTKKLELVIVLAIIINLLLSIGVSILFFSFSIPTLILSILVFLVLSILFFIALSIASLIVLPFDLAIKKSIINKAKAKIGEHKNLKIIGIAGSYGKTSMKESLNTILSSKFRVLDTPDNINTPVGISKLILDELKDDTEIFIVEMGEFYRGDIKKICEITKPDISIVTGINEAHLERLGSIETTIATIFEVAENTRPDGFCILNADSKNVLENYLKFTKNLNNFFYSSKPNYIAKYQVANKHFLEDASGIQFDLYDTTKKLTTVKVSLLGEYAIGTITGAAIASKILGMDFNDISNAILDIKQVPHRLQSMENQNGLIIIDDSYNGNPDGAVEAMKVLARFTNRRRVYITPGLVETGSKSKEIHLSLGEKLANSANVVILIRNTVTPFIEEGLVSAGFDKNQIIWFDSALEAHSNLNSVLKKGDVVLFQNDWSDNYF